MIRISVRDKIILELYTSVSLFSAIIVLLYYSFSDRIGGKLYLQQWDNRILSYFIYLFLRTLILDVNSVKFEGDDSIEDQSMSK